MAKGWGVVPSFVEGGNVGGEGGWMLPAQWVQAVKERETQVGGGCCTVLMAWRKGRRRGCAGGMCGRCWAFMVRRARMSCVLPWSGVSLSLFVLCCVVCCALQAKQQQEGGEGSQQEEQKQEAEKVEQKEKELVSTNA